MTQSVKDEAKFLDTRLDDETAAVLEKWNLVILGAALLHDADHIRQAIRWRYKIPMQLWIINLAVYVLPTVAEFLLKNKRTSSFLTVAANGIVTSAAFLKVHLFKPTTDIWGAWNYNYFKLARGVWHEGQFIKGIDWIDWALLLDLPAVAIPACMTAIKKRREFKQNLLEAGEANERHLAEDSGHGVRRVRGAAGPRAGKAAGRAARGGELHRRVGAHHL